MGSRLSRYDEYCSAVAAYEAKDYDRAMQIARALIEELPYLPHAFRLLRASLLALGDREGLRRLDREIDDHLPGYTDVGMRIGSALYSAGYVAEAKAQFSKSLSSRRMMDESQLLPFGVVGRQRLIHDERYLDYLIDQGVVDAERYLPVVTAIGTTLEKYPDNQNQALDLSEASLMNIADIYRKVVFLHEGPTLANVVNKPALKKCLNDLLSRRTIKAAFGDDFFLPDAFAHIRKHLLLSTIWHNDDHRGANYVSSDDTIGLLDAVLHRAAKEIEETVVEILGDLRLEQVWAFKALGGEGRKGINTHADYSALNINIWMTPDEYNSNPSSGGLKIYERRKPEEAEFESYNGTEQYVAGLIAQSESEIIPYRCNRFVVFDGTHFHESYDVEFDERYVGWRMNLTFIFSPDEGTS